MASTDLHKLVVKLEAESAKLHSELEKSTRKLDKFEKNTKTALKSVKKHYKTLDDSIRMVGLGVAFLAGPGALGALIKAKAAAASQAVAYSQALGIDVQQLTSMAAATKTVGIEQDKLADIFKDVSEKVADAYATGGGEAKDALEQLGLSASELASKSPDQILLSIASALGNVQTQGEKVFIMESLANDASLLLPLLENDAEKLRDIAERAKETGVAINDVDAAKLKAANDAMIEFEGAVSGVATTIALEFAPPMATFLKDVGEGLPAAVKASRIALNIMQLGYLAVTEAVEELLVKRDEIDKMFFGLEYDDTVYREHLADLNETRAAILSIKKEQSELILGKPKPQAEADGTAPGMTVEVNYEQLYSKQIAQHEQYLLTKAASLEQAIMRDDERLIQAHDRQQAMIDEALARNVISDTRAQELKLRTAQKFSDDMIKVEQKKTAALTTLEQSRTDSALYLMNALGQKSKAFAITAFVFQKAMAVKQILLQTEIAAAAALTPPPIGLGPVAGMPLAAKIRAAGYTSAALTGVGALVEGYNRFGEEEKPLPDPTTTSLSGNDSVAQLGIGPAGNATTGTHYEIHMPPPEQGMMYSSESVHWLVDRLREGMQNGTITLIENDYEQADIIRGTA